MLLILEIVHAVAAWIDNIPNKYVTVIESNVFKEFPKTSNC